MIRESKLAYDQIIGMGKIYEESFPVIDNRLRNIFNTGDLLAIKKVYVFGDGDSYHAALASRSAFLNLTDAAYFPFPAMKFLGYEIDYLQDSSPGQSLIVGISASGESRRVIQCIQKAKEKIPDACFLAMTGNPNSTVAKIADRVFDLSLPDSEIHRSPGVRSYLASLFGLASLAIRLGEIQGKYHMTEANAMREKIAAQGEFVAPIVEQADIQAESIRRYGKTSFFTLAGSGNHFGTAYFSAAKLTEIAGLCAVAQDLEEWMHVEQFSYPVDTPLIVFAPKGASFDHAKILMERAKKIGHPLIVVTDEPENTDIKSLADLIFPVYGSLEEHFMHLLFFIPSVSMGVFLARELGRAMFLSDQDAIQDERTAWTKKLREDV